MIPPSVCTIIDNIRKNVNEIHGGKFRQAKFHKELNVLRAQYAKLGERKSLEQAEKIVRNKLRKKGSKSLFLHRLEQQDVAAANVGSPSMGASQGTHGTQATQGTQKSARRAGRKNKKEKVLSAKCVAEMVRRHVNNTIMKQASFPGCRAPSRALDSEKFTGDEYWALVRRTPCGIASLCMESSTPWASAPRRAKCVRQTCVEVMEVVTKYLRMMDTAQCQCSLGGWTTFNN